MGMATIYPSQNVRQSASFTERPRTLLNKNSREKKIPATFKRTDGQILDATLRWHCGRACCGYTKTSFWLEYREALAAQLSYCKYRLLVIIHKKKSTKVSDPVTTKLPSNLLGMLRSLIRDRQLQAVLQSVPNSLAECSYKQLTYSRLRMCFFI